MPLYTYQCDKCGFTIERLEDVHSKSEAAPCPVRFQDRAMTPLQSFSDCGGTIRRIPSVPAPAVFNCPMPTYQRPKT